MHWTEAFWTAYGVLAVIGLAAIARLGRLVELHHLYWGAAIALIPWTPTRIVGLVLMLDDTVQHAVQAAQLLTGHAPEPDWSPVHRAYVAVYRWVASW